ncbi:glycosyltransferase [Chryseobacterium echinoideorum]|uniref:glycosyltransferase n=1 Tax=Chryseobacterium echinoideorum TaxID=1549648 RepID=UPI0016253519|nr:glycosyltransferase [Chryseobacterium echinoideorum]
MSSLVFGIVCFREKFWETESFISLIESFKQSVSCNNIIIYIYDNTDFEYWSVSNEFEIAENIKIFYFWDSKNTGISAAYNHIAKFANNNAVEWIVFLDQDTFLPLDFVEKYFERCKETSKKILFPKVYSNQALLSPSIYRFYRTFKIKKLGNEIMLKHITAINSGLMIQTNFFFQHHGYDSCLKIDFCDHEFIERINNKNIIAEIINIRLEQNFSGNSNNLQKSLDRYKIYLNDLKSYSKNKNKILIFFMLDFPHLLKETFRNKSLAFLKIRYYFGRK